jgi:hypothetical protein
MLHHLINYHSYSLTVLAQRNKVRFESRSVPDSLDFFTPSALLSRLISDLS